MDAFVTNCRCAPQMAPMCRLVLVIITNMTVCWWKAEANPTFDINTLQNLDNCRVFRTIGPGSWIPPQSSLIYKTAIATPVDSPRLIVISRIAYARGDRLRLAEDAEEARQRECRGRRPVRLQEESRFKGLAQEDKYLIYADFEGDGGISYYFDSHPLDCPYRANAVDAGDDDLMEYFGATERTAHLEEWLSVIQPPETAGTAEPDPKEPVLIP